MGMSGDEVVHRHDGPDPYLRENVKGTVSNGNGIHGFSGLHAGFDETGLGGVRAAKEEVDGPADEVVLFGDPDPGTVPKHCVGIAHNRSYGEHGEVLDATPGGRKFGGGRGWNWRLPVLQTRGLPFAYLACTQARVWACMFMPVSDPRLGLRGRGGRILRNQR